MADFSFERVESLKELREILPDLSSPDDDKDYSFIAGGTDLIVKLRKGKEKPRRVIDITGLDEIKKIKLEADSLKIGAAATFSQIASSELIREKAKALAVAASQVGSVQIRNRATIGGNIANASPAADSIPPLLALEAKLITIDKDGKEREKYIKDVLLDIEKTNLEADELIKEIIIPVNEEYKSGFFKLGRRKSVAIARLNMAVSIKHYQNGLIEDARVAFGALGPTAFCSELAEKALIGNYPDKTTLKEFFNSVCETVDDQIPNRSSYPYKREAIKGLSHDFFQEIFRGFLDGGGVANG